MPFFSCFLTSADADDDNSNHGANVGTEDGHTAAVAEMRAQHVARGAIPDRPCYLCRCGEGAADPRDDWRMSARAIHLARGEAASVATAPFVLESVSLRQTATPSLATTNALVFMCGYNRRGQNDVGGAFRNEAYRFVCFCKNRVPTLASRIGALDPCVVVVNNGHFDEHPPRSLKTQTVWAFEQRQAANAPLLKVVAFFGHGEPYWMQFGFDVPNTAVAHPGTGNLDELVAAMRGTCATDVRVIIYGCSAGATPGTDHDGLHGDNNGIGGLADALRTGLVGAGLTSCRVDAHASVAHTTTNPRVRRFEGAGPGGAWIIAPTNPPASTAAPAAHEARDRWVRWVDAVLRHPTELRFLFPFLDSAEVATWLAEPTNFHRNSPFRTPPAGH